MDILILAACLGLFVWAVGNLTGRRAPTSGRNTQWNGNAPTDADTNYSGEVGRLEAALERNAAWDANQPVHAPPGKYIGYEGEGESFEQMQRNGAERYRTIADLFQEMVRDRREADETIIDGRFND